MTTYIWHTGHEINETISRALHAGIPDTILKHTEWADNYINSTNKSVAIGYGILRGTGDIFKHNAMHGVDYYEVDRGYINPKHYNGYYRISKNGMQAKYVDKDLPSDRLDRLRFKRENWFNPKGRVIVCPPSDYIEHYYGLLPGGWLSQIEAFLTKHGEKYKVRNKSDTTPLEHDLNGAKCVFTYNSNVAIEAIIKGIPVHVGLNSICHPILGGYIDVEDGIFFPSRPEDVDKLLRFISYNQFTLEEIKDGTAWRILSAA